MTQVPFNTRQATRLRKIVQPPVVAQPSAEEVEAILSRPNAMTASGMINPEVVTREEAGLISTYRALETVQDRQPRGPVAAPSLFQEGKALTGPVAPPTPFQQREAKGLTDILGAGLSAGFSVASLPIELGDLVFKAHATGQSQASTSLLFDPMAGAFPVNMEDTRKKIGQEEELKQKLDEHRAKNNGKGPSFTEYLDYVNETHKLPKYVRGTAELVPWLFVPATPVLRGTLAAAKATALARASTSSSKVVKFANHRAADMLDMVNAGLMPIAVAESAIVKGFGLTIGKVKNAIFGKLKPRLPDIPLEGMPATESVANVPIRFSTKYSAIAPDTMQRMYDDVMASVDSAINYVDSVAGTIDEIYDPAYMTEAFPVEAIKRIRPKQKVNKTWQQMSDSEKREIINDAVQGYGVRADYIPESGNQTKAIIDDFIDHFIERSTTGRIADAPIPGGVLLSGREVGGPQNVIPGTRPDPIQMLDDAMNPPSKSLYDKAVAFWNRILPSTMLDQNYILGPLSKRTGVPAHQYAQLIPGAYSAGQEKVRLLWKPMLDELGEENWPALTKYLTLWRMRDLQYVPGYKLPLNMSASDVTANLDNLAKELGKTEFAKVENTAKALWQLNDQHVMKRLVDTGFITEGEYLALKTTHPHYLPFGRQDTTGEIGDFLDNINNFSASAGTVKQANVSSVPLKEMKKGGADPLQEDIFARYLNQIPMIETLVWRNNAAKKIIEALKISGEDMRILGPNDDAVNTGARGTISYFDEGQQIRAVVPSVYAQVAKGLANEPDNTVLQIARFLNAPLRMGATTYNPLFMIVNVMRDAETALFRENLIPLGPDYIKGMIAAFTKNSLYSDAAQSGVFMSGLVDNMRVDPGKVKMPFGRVWYSVKNIRDIPMVIPRLIETANVNLERGTRIGAFSKLRNEGVDEIERNIRARNVSVDFAKAGTAMRVINQVLPFTNAAVQGGANMIRTIKNHPKRSLGYAALFATPTIMVRANNSRFETSDQIPDWEYVRGWPVQYGEWERKDGTKGPLYLTVPKGEPAAMLTFSIEAMMLLMRETEDRSYLDLLLSQGLQTAQRISPVDVSVPLPGAFETMVAQQTGVDMFTGRPIVPRGEEGRLPEQQFGPETSTTAIKLGQMFNVSPRLIDHALKRYAATAGAEVNELISMALEAMNLRPDEFGTALQEAPPTSAETLSRKPGISRFLGASGSGVDARWWDKYDETLDNYRKDFIKLPYMNELGINFPDAPRTDTITYKEKILPSEQIEFTPQDRTQYLEILFPLVMEYVNKTLSDSNFNDWPPELQKDEIAQAIADAKEDTMSNPIMMQIKQDRREKDIDD